MRTTKRLSITIRGKVQGVWFRVRAADEAGNLGLTGWVKNAGATQVDCQAEGNPEMLDAFIEWCEKGPPLARVDEVLSEEIPIEGDSDFDIRR